MEVIMKKMETNFRRYSTEIFWIFFLIVLSPALIATVMYQNTTFEGSGQMATGKVLGERVQNTTEEYLEGRDNNITIPEAESEVLGRETQNLTAKEARGQSITAPDIGLKNASFARLTNVSNTSYANEHNRIHSDKLLDGLVASGFEKVSCISRFDSYLYRKASPHKPSQYLISKLRNYEDLHRKCGVHTKAYKRTMVKLVRSKNHNAGTVCKYLVWTPVNGLGNRMISMAAAFLYALVTDRVLLVEFQSDMVDLFCEPFPNSTWILPKDFPFRNKYAHIETYQNMLKKDKGNGSKEIVPSVMHLNMQHTFNDPKKLFHCNHSQDLLQQVSLLILQSDQYFVPSLFMTPSFNPELNKMFLKKDTVFHHLGRYLFHPSNEAWGLISRFYQTYLANADERIGLQIRVFRPDHTPHQRVMELLLSCTLKNKLLPELDKQNFITSISKNQTLKVVLLASLYRVYGDNLRTMYLSEPTVTGEMIGVCQPSHEEHQKFHDNRHNMMAWTEIYLLSMSDTLVTTSLSTFGYVAQGLGGLKPWLLYRIVGNETHNPACERDISMEPCFHIPPKYNCEGKAMEHLGLLYPHMRKCVDYSSGIKLINDSN
ncbi:hypothetical protein L6164_004573 [Bauhinia variegata]|uniref:Uncharacterized protein n=1 Tax=Bauhinia variegata TaxID=167791 RepID=A0ACB9Q4U2_BAUVA|nr:hypothetical protein L6164_004573 [Bauhinia variegata]